MTLIIGVEDIANNRAIVAGDSGAWRGDQADHVRTPKIWRSHNRTDVAGIEDHNETVCATPGCDRDPGDERYCAACLSPYQIVPVDDPSLESRYAAFRETVERVVREVAPKAPVVTDRVFGNEERADGILVMFTDGLIEELVFPFTHTDATFAFTFRYHLDTYLMAAGKRVTGAK